MKTIGAKVWLLFSVALAVSGCEGSPPDANDSATHMPQPSNARLRSSLVPAGATSIGEGFALLPIAQGLEQAVAFAFAADERIYLAEKAGKVRLVRHGQLAPEPFLDLSAEVNGFHDRGLLGIAVHPAFPEQPYVYLLYTYDPPELASGSEEAALDGAGARVSRLVRVTADKASDYSLALPDSAIVLLGTNSNHANIGRADAHDTYEPPSCGGRGAYVRDCLPSDGHSHSIGSVAFGPDGALYVSNGDGCDFVDAQPACARALDLDSLAGKILRIDPVSGLGVADNPFAADDLRSNRAKVYQLGLRNPFRFAFDPSGALYVGDVGWNVWEEINRAPAGANFGWPCYEGGHGVNVEQAIYRDFPRCAELATSGAAVTPALYAYAHDGAGAAVLLGDFYRGASYPERYRGALFYSDFDQRQLRYLRFAATGEVQSSHLLAHVPGGLTQIAAEPVSGDLYVVRTGANEEDPGASSLERLVYVGFGPGPAPGEIYAIESNDSGRCLAARTRRAIDGSTSSRLELSACQSVAAQRWQLESAGDELYRVTSERLGQVLAAGSGQEPQLLAASSDDATQHWRIRPRGDSYELIHAASERCLATRSNRLVVLPCSTDGAQLFQVLSQQNRPPRLSPVADQASTRGDQVHLALEAQDPEAGEVTYFASGLPDGLSIDPQTGIITGELSTPGTFAVQVRASDGQQESTRSFTWRVAADQLPEVIIAAPAEGLRYAPGDVIAFSGSASDASGRPIPPAQLHWELFVHHNQHIHADALPPTEGTHGSFVTEDHGENTALELCLLAEDSAGRVGRACHVLLPAADESAGEAN